MLTTPGVAGMGITLDVQLLKEQNKYDQIPLNIFDHTRRVSPLMERVADEIVCEETEILEEIIPRMFKVMQRVAEYSCDYVRRGRFGRQLPFNISHVLMIAARTVGGLVNQGDIERDLTKVIEDFDRAVNVEALRSAKKTGEHLFLARWFILTSYSVQRRRFYWGGWNLSRQATTRISAVFLAPVNSFSNKSRAGRPKNRGGRRAIHTGSTACPGSGKRG